MVESSFAAPLEVYKGWLDELHDELAGQSQKFDRIVEGLLKANRIFTVATGRSELMIRNFGIRLMHEGYDVFRIGESYTPAIGNDPKRKDVLLIFTGSGKTRFVIRAEEIANENHVPIYGVCSNADSEAVKLAGEQNMIITKGKRIYREGEQVPQEDQRPVNFLQTKSEFKAFCVGELIISKIAIAKGLTENDFRSRHSNTE
jgi:6-phospho-3-hexuloisomerase